MPAGGRGVGLETACCEGALELVVEVNPIGHKHHARVHDLFVQSKATGKHDHREGFARPLGMPDDSTRATAIVLPVFDPREDILDGEELLIAADLFNAKVEQRKSTGEIKQ